jgi:hypothetical protein
MPTIPWDNLGKFADVLQILSFIFPLVTGAYFLIKSRQLNRRLQALATTLSKRPVAIAIGLGGSIEGNVRQYLKDNSLEMEVVTCIREGAVQPGDFPGILRELQDVRARLDEIGVTEVHVFYKGPVTFATALGAMFRNWVPAKIYAFEGGTYVLHMRLDKEMIIAP